MVANAPVHRLIGSFNTQIVAKSNFVPENMRKNASCGDLVFGFLDFLQDSQQTKVQKDKHLRKVGAQETHSLC